MNFSKTYKRQDFLSFLKSSFLPEDFDEETLTIPLHTQTTYTQSVTKIGVCKSLDLVVYEIKHNSENDARVTLSKEAFRLLSDELEDRALVLFVPEDDASRYRFSLITIDLGIDSKGNIVREYSNPRRFSYFLGEGIPTHTPNKYLLKKGRVVDAIDLQERFSIEVLTKEFYSELSDWFAWALTIVNFPYYINNEESKEVRHKQNTESTIRLITRVIFVWFIKQKKLIPDEFFNEEYIANHLLKEFAPNDTDGLFEEKSLESKYYKAILQNLFFAMLNSPITPDGKGTVSERHFRNNRSDYDNNKLMRYEDLFCDPQLFINLANSTVPFLNGGLFECLDKKDEDCYVDGFSDRIVVQRKLIVPDYLFFGEKENLDLSYFYGDDEKSKKNVHVSGLIHILKKYNFTVEENTPFDQEVSLDPELLGKVFENLLASYNPETKTTARKQTGSFYTPREIVQYMVDESLVAHLKRTVGENLEDEYRNLLAYTDVDISLEENQKKDIIEAIYNCKILDPACGSGAFPVGVLQQMVHILSQLDPDNKQWKELLINTAVKEAEDALRNTTASERTEILLDIEQSFDEQLNRPDYARKLYLIENCIYGVDIQPIAIQISKLRFFISLVVDQKTTNKPEENFGIRPLPNLEAKFIAADSLIGLEKTDISLFNTDRVKELMEGLKKANHKIFGAKTVQTKRKYKEIVKQLRLKIADELHELGAMGEDEAQAIASWDMFDQNRHASFFDSEWMFGVSDGFDIVIGNPPYISYYGNKGVKLSSNRRTFFVKYYNHIKKVDDRINSMNLMTERGVSLLKDKGTIAFITNKTMSILPSYRHFRKLFLNNVFFLSLITDLSPFNAIVDCIIFIGSKEKVTNKKVANCTKHMKFLSNDNYIWHISKYENILDIIDLNKKKLSDIITINRGLNIGGKSEYFLSSEKSIGYKKYLSGTKNISPYTYEWEKGDGFIKVDLELERKLKEKGATIALGDPLRYSQPHLFIPESGQRIMAAYCHDEIYGAYGLLVATHKNDIKNLFYSLLLLNSNIVSFYCTEKEILRKGSKATPHVGVKGLRGIPIPRITPLMLDDIYKLATLILFCRKENSTYSIFFEQLANAVISELYLPDIFKYIDISFLKDLSKLRTITINDLKIIHDFYIQNKCLENRLKEYAIKHQYLTIIEEC
ncbi:MAG: restriction endonuclease subunit M [Bacteroidales bacterium]|nr:restriction endonuclease subunit M [Bacteroidales bacterium]